MRVAILGTGGVGRTLATELWTDELVSSLLLVDRIGERARVFERMSGRIPMEAVELDVENRSQLARALKKADVVVNATLPKYNLAIMETALDIGANYLDLAATGPRKPGGLPGILEQLQMHDPFEDAGLMALLSMGLDPGMTNVLAREAADKLDAIDTIRIRSGGTVNVPNFGSAFPLYSPEAFLTDILLRPTVWLNGRLEGREPFGEEEDFKFPRPVGTQRCFLISHEEVKTLPRFLGKPVKRVDFKYALDSRLIRALLALDSLGLLKESRSIRIGNQTVPFRRAFLAVFPEPSALVRPLKGTKCVSVEVEGTKAGVPKVYRSDITLSHREANRRRFTTAVYYLTAVGAAIGVGMLLRKALPGAGVYPPEVLPPERVLNEWNARDLRVIQSERTLAGEAVERSSGIIPAGSYRASTARTAPSG